MTECGFLLPVEEDTMDIRLFEQIRELHFCDEELQWELIPMRRFIFPLYMFNINLSLEKFLTNWVVVSVKPWLAKLTVTNTSRNSTESIGHWANP